MSGGSGVGERWDGIFGVIGGDGREWAKFRGPSDVVWVSVEGASRSEHRRCCGGSRYVNAKALPPPERTVRLISYFADGRWFPAPPPPVGAQPDPGQPLPGVLPAQDRGESVVSRVSHRVWQDFGTDGVRRWPRWWCSCGAGGLGWPTSHSEED